MACSQCAMHCRAGPAMYALSHMRAEGGSYADENIAAYKAGISGIDHHLEAQQQHSSSNSHSSSDGGAAAVEVAAVGAGWGSLVAPPGAQGAKLLAVLHARRLNGQPLLQTCIQRLLWHVNQVLFNQLTMW